MPDELASDNLRPPACKARILVIDDEADIRESLATLLELEGYVVELAANGNRRPAQSRSRQLRPDFAGSHDAGPFRHGSAERSARARLGNADFHDHRLRLGGSRRERAEERRQRLFFQALGQRKAADRDRADDRASAAWSAKIFSSSARSNSNTASPISSARATACCASSIW